MHNSNGPSAYELPSTKKLIKSTVLAALVAVILLFTVVMPAEYGIDPTGIGNAIGLTRMGEIKVSLAEEAAADTEATPTPFAAPAAPDKLTPELDDSQGHETKITLAPDQGREIKVTMTKGDKVEFSWATDGGKANYDVHGDSKSLGINYHSYSKGSEQTHQGEIEAAFDGSHGWYWRNRASTPMTITLQTKGQYTKIQKF